MTALTLARLAHTVGGRLHGDDRAFSGVGTDTRALEPKQLFVALRGARFDGHAFAAAAAAAGAAGALVDHAVDAPLPQVVVDDTLVALTRYASAHRAGFTGPVVGVTGSNGKTSVKEMTAAILRRGGPVLATRGNLNNHIGVPLTLLGLDAAQHAAVVELGANHPGEIAALAATARPTVGVVTNAGPAHLEGFGDVAGVARAKGELFAALPADGVAVINAADAHAPTWRALAAHCTRVEFALDADADYAAQSAGVRVTEAGGQAFELTTPVGDIDVELPVPGLHNVANALAAAAAAIAAGASLADVRGALAALAPVAGRLRTRRARGGARVIDDTYNANPASLDAALGVLARAAGRRWLVLGDMGELGAQREALHAAAGARARATGIERLFALGPLAAVAADAFGGGECFSDAAALGARVAAELAPDVTVLVKGSRSMRLERVVAALVEEG